jgi:phosphotriesterase-related protein
MKSIHIPYKGRVMTNVNTVCGLIDSKDLGFMLMHEHLANSSAGIPQVFPEFMDTDLARDAGIRALADAYSEGIRSYMDVTTMDLGRDMQLIKSIAENSKVHVILATGLWLDIPRAIVNGVTADQLADSFVKEIEIGIEGTHIKAGIIKVATSEEGVTPGNELVLRAASRAAIQTGVPISTHTAAREKVGNDQIEIFENEGVDLRKVYIGHSNDTDDIEYLTGLADKGCTVGLDRYPGGFRGSIRTGLDWEERTVVAAKLIELGYQKKISLSHDFPITFMRLPDQELARQEQNPEGICFISRIVLPRLRQLGVQDSAIESMMVDVPRNLFDGV